MRDYITVGIFKSKRSGEEYKVSLSCNITLDDNETELSCNCKGWIYHRKCKHIAHVLHGSNEILQTEAVEL